MNRVRDKVAVVTGAGSGMGRAFAQILAEEGARVLAVDIRGQEETAAANSAGAITPAQCDVTSPQAVEALFAECSARFGRLDILCNNAGIIKGGPRIHETPLEDWDRVMEVNLRGAFLVLKYALPLMMASGGGSIINTASTSAIRAVAGNGAYTPAKGAVAQLTKMAALEYAGDKIRVNAICPGPIETPIVEKLPPGRKETLMKALPLGRFGTPKEVANLVLFLASDEASFITGACYAIDGGRLAS